MCASDQQRRQLSRNLGAAAPRRTLGGGGAAARPESQAPSASNNPFRICSMHYHYPDIGKLHDLGF